MYTFTALFSFFVVLLLVKTAAWVRKTVHARNAARHLGCLPAPEARNHGLFGLRTLLASIRATKEEWGPIFMHQAINEIKLAASDVNGAPMQAHTIRAQILDSELLITRDPENVKAMFATQAEDFDIGTHRENTFRSLLGPGVFANRGQKWRHSRALVRGQFARWNVADPGLLHGHTNALMGHLKGAASTGEWTTSADIMPLFYAFTLDVSTQFLFGSSTSLLSPETRPDRMKGPKGPDFDNFGRHLDAAKSWLDLRGALAKFGWLLRDNEFPTHCAAVQDFVDYFVHQKLDHRSSTTVAAEEKNPPLPDSHNEDSQKRRNKFILLDHLATETTDPLELRSELLNVLHASRDTTAALLSWTIYFLARHPAVYAKLRAEILSSATTTDSDDDELALPTQTPYLTHTLNETIRLAAIVPMNERMALRDTSLPQGGGPDGRSPVFVAQGQQVLIPTYSMQHRTDLWGEDAGMFRPERWDERAKRTGWEFVPFGAGVRQCLGQQFARFEASYVLVRMLRQFDRLENTEVGDGKLRMHHTIENRPGGGVHVAFRVAESPP